MADSHGRGWPKARKVEHTHEHEPPRQIKRVPPGDDNWGLRVTSLAVTDPKVSSETGDEISNTALNTSKMNPVYGEHDSAYIHESHTQGKRGE